jgi:hypothetical protein
MKKTFLVFMLAVQILILTSFLSALYAIEIEIPYAYYDLSGTSGNGTVKVDEDQDGSYDWAFYFGPNQAIFFDQIKQCKSDGHGVRINYHIAHPSAKIIDSVVCVP